MNISYVPNPTFQSFAGFTQLKKADSMEAKKIYIDLFLKGKTRVNISLYWKETKVTANMQVPGSEGFKFNDVTTYSFSDYKEHTNQYFTLSKKQNLAQLEEHIKNVIAYYYQLPKEAEFEIMIYDNEAVREIKARFPAPIAKV